jgi:serine/threonine protein kinase
METQTPAGAFGRYELLSLLGRGGMASTWLARWVAEAGVSRTVVIKRILASYASDERFISMFINEARISTGLSHGNVAQVFDFGKVGEEYFLAMEYVDGQPLHRVLRQARTRGMVGLPLSEATFITLEMCRGLHYAHSRLDEQGRPLGIVHRDVSPDNVLVSYEGQVKLVDFGIAKARSLSTIETDPGVIKGKYAYCSPEQLSGLEVDARTDVWATGVVLYQLLCGQQPFTGSVPQLILQIVQGEFPRPRELRPDLPEELERILLKALAVKLPRRYPSAQALADDLSAFLNATDPRFSVAQVMHLMQELFRAELRAAGRPSQLTPTLVTCPTCGSPRTLTPRCPRCGNSYSQPKASAPHAGSASAPEPRPPLPEVSPRQAPHGAMEAPGVAAQVATSQQAAPAEPPAPGQAARPRLDFARLLRGVARYPFTSGGLRTFGALVLAGVLFNALQGLVFPGLAPWVALAASGFTWLYLLAVLLTSAEGRDTLEWRNLPGLLGRALQPTGMCLVAMVAAWLPALLYALLGHGRLASFELLASLLVSRRLRVDALSRAVLWDDPVLWGLLLAGLAFLPPALLFASRRQLEAALSPRKVLESARLLGRDYGLTVAGLAALIGLTAVFSSLLPAVRAGAQGLSPGVLLIEPVGLLGPLLMARVLGLLAHVRGEELESPLREEQASSQSDIARMMTTARAEESTALGGPTPEQQIAELSAAVEARDVQQALELYTRMQLPVMRIPAACHFFVGQSASAQAQYALAIRALEAAADAEPDGPLAPRALVLMARVLGERLGATARARQAYQYVLARYPGTDAARFAQGQLAQFSNG